MSLFLQRIDAFSPAADSEFSFSYITWLSVLIDTLNEIIATIQDALNQTSAPQYTTAQITTLALTSPNGTLWYDITTNELKALVNGVVVVLA